MLYKTKWYIVDLLTRQVYLGRHFDRCWEGIDWAQGRFKKATVLRGSHILEHLDTWKVEGELCNLSH